MAKTAIGEKRSRNVDYKQLNSISSAVLYDTARRSKKSKLFEVERVITRRKIRYDYEYLIKWKGWPLDASSWEPACNLTTDLLRNYEKPPITDSRLAEACCNFCVGVTSTLKSPRSSPVYINMGLDVWRFVTCGKGVPLEHRGNQLFVKGDMSRFKYLPEYWWYYINQDGEGVALDFPFKARPVLSWSPEKYIQKDGKLVRAPRFPIEKVCLTVVRRACNADNIL